MLARPWDRFAPLALAGALHASLLTGAATSWAQPRPSQDLVARGRALFDDQQYEESIQTLSGALVRPNNTKPQKLEIYRLLALNYITLNRKDEAESAVRGLLALQPDYALPASESPRFRDFFAAVKQRWEAEGRPGLVKETEAAPAAVVMKHSSPSQAAPRTQVNLTAHMDDPQHRVVGVKIYFRAGSHGKFDETDASLADGDVKATIPRDSVKPPLVEYYLQGFDKGGLPIVTRGDAAAPLRIAVPEGGKGWVLPVVIAGGVVAAGLVVVGILVASKSSPATGTSTVTVNVGQ